MKTFKICACFMGIFALFFLLAGCEKKAPKKKSGFIHPSKIPDFMPIPQDSELTVLPSGLKYRILRTGTGKSPHETEQVEVHYRGTLMDGKEFDSSYGRGEPAIFRVNQVIKGWTQALQMMKEGGRWQIIIPPDLGYGAMGAGNVIPPNATLNFEVELIKVIK